MYTHNQNGMSQQASKDPLHHIRFNYNNPFKFQANQDAAIGADILKIYKSLQTASTKDYTELIQQCSNVEENYSAILAIKWDTGKDEVKHKPVGWDIGADEIEHKPMGWDIEKDGAIPKPRQSLGFNKNPLGEDKKTGFPGTNGNQTRNSYPNPSGFNNGLYVENRTSTYQIKSNFDNIQMTYSQNVSALPSMKLSTIAKEQDINNFMAKFQCTRATAIGYIEAFGDYQSACREYLKNN